MFTYNFLSSEIVIVCFSRENTSLLHSNLSKSSPLPDAWPSLMRPVIPAQWRRTSRGPWDLSSSHYLESLDSSPAYDYKRSGFPSILNWSLGWKDYFCHSKKSSLQDFLRVRDMGCGKDLAHKLGCMQHVTTPTDSLCIRVLR